MSYTIILDEGVVIRDRDQKQVAPCDSEHDPDFKEYNAWIDLGNEPKILNTRHENA